MATKSPKVNEKSTKTDIWEAYKQLVSELEQRPVSVSDDTVKLRKLSATLNEAKASLLGHFDATIERLGNLQQAYNEADQDLEYRKSLTLEGIENYRKQLDASVAAVRKQWDQEKADNELKHQREEETYAYNLSIKRRNDEEQYSQRAREREARLAERETAANEKEQEYLGLMKQVEAFPTQLEEAAIKVREELTNELKTEYDTSLRELKQAAEHEKSIMILKLQSAESTIGSQAKQLADLQKQLDSSTSQLKEMAVAVIQSKSEATSQSS